VDSSNLLSAGFSVAAVLAWGAADFLGGLTARRADAMVVTALSHAGGMVLMTCLALAGHAAFPARSGILWALGAGASGGVALAFFYRSLGSGTMGLNAPVAAVLGGSIPVLVTFATQGLPHPVQLAGFILAALGIWFISQPDHLTGPPQGLGLAVLAGLGFAGFFLCVKQTGGTSAAWSAALAKICSFVLVGALVLVRHVGGWTERGGAWMGLLAGVLDVSGTYLFIRATQTGRLDVAVVLTSLYPATTVLLARIFLKERFTLRRAVGMAAALVAMPLIVLR
jgi:drug/metabolite transporter (DMT)-like permease